MSLTTIFGSASAATPSATTHRTAPPESGNTGSDTTTTAGSIEAAVSDGAGAAVSFSKDALKALKQAGETAVASVAEGSSSVAEASKSVLGEAEGLAGEAWRGIKHAARDVANVVEAAGDDVVTGVEDAISAAKTAAAALGHYAGIALDDTDDAASDVTRDAVLAASTAGSKVVSQLL